ncbi:hypothetical protein [Sphingobium ummariense]
MTGEELFWTKFAAIGQMLGALATLAAVVVSLMIASRSRRPALRLVVGKRIILSPSANDLEMLVFRVSNIGERHATISALGWRTGWTRRGPSFLRTQAAIQVMGSLNLGETVPFDLPPAGSVSCFASWENVVANAVAASPFFTRDWPIFGRRATRVVAFIETADGHVFRVKPEASFRRAIFSAEVAASQRVEHN